MQVAGISLGSFGNKSSASHLGGGGAGDKLHANRF